MNAHEIGGAEGLLAAMIRQASEDIRHNSQRTRLYRDAESWVRSDDTTYALSFRSICETLSLEPGYIRRQIYSGLENKAKRGAA